jgi:hypothetical protein
LETIIIAHWSRSQEILLKYLKVWWQSWRIGPVPLAGGLGRTARLETQPLFRRRPALFSRAATVAVIGWHPDADDDKLPSNIWVGNDNELTHVQDGSQSAG